MGAHDGVLPIEVLVPSGNCRARASIHHRKSNAQPTRARPTRTQAEVSSPSLKHADVRVEFSLFQNKGDPSNPNRLQWSPIAPK